MKRLLPGPPHSAYRRPTASGRRRLGWLISLAILGSGLAFAYPLDGYESTGIRRLLAYRLMQEGKMAGNIKLPPGALLSSNQIQLRLAGINEGFDITPKTPLDPQWQAGLEKIIANRHPSYRAALLDITDPLHPRFAAVNPDQGYIPGSVGKLLVLTGLFNELKRRFPNDVVARAELLRTTQITADSFVLPNHHAVPVVNSELTAVTHRAIRVGDVFSLWEWVDHMVSPSSNAAGSMVWKQVLLMRELGPDYPPSAEREAEYFKNTPKNELTERSIAVLEEPLREEGLDTEDLRLGTYFTTNASRVVPGKSSYATPRQLLRWLLRVEQGKVVDRWSSLEIKKLLYFTRRRYRYASSGALANAAVFFKSGSLFRCKPEPDYQCVQYKGNVENLMHSVAIVESASRSGGPPKIYMVSIMSNVLKVNSAQEHMQIATEIERMINP